MYSGQTHDKGQRLASRGNEVLSQEAVQLLKTQDAGYLRTIAQQTRRTREKLEKGYVLGEGKGVEVRGGGSQGKGEHVVFVRDKEEQKGFDPDTGVVEPGPLSKASQTGHGPWVDTEDVDDAGTDDEEAVETTAPAAKSRRVREAQAIALRQARNLRKQRKREQDAQLSRLKALKAREKEVLAAEQELGLQRAKMSNSNGGVNKAGVKFKMRERKR
jgi:U3 small nucleolar RNA-associated protein 11